MHPHPDCVKCRELLNEFEPEIQAKATVADSLGKPYLICVNDAGDKIQVGIIDWDDAEAMFQAECSKNWDKVKKEYKLFPNPLLVVCQCRNKLVFRIGPRKATKRILELPEGLGLPEDLIFI